MLRFPVPAALSFPRSHRLAHDLQYQAVYGARIKKSRGPLTLFAIPNSLPHHRLGLAIGRRVGNAVQRNRLKRLLREAFRLSQDDLPRPEAASYDFVINAKAHDALALANYQQLLLELASDLHEHWGRKAKRRREQSTDAD
jgi:ribonuclease P protein component